MRLSWATLILTVLSVQASAQPTGEKPSEAPAPTVQELANAPNSGQPIEPSQGNVASPEHNKADEEVARGDSRPGAVEAPNDPTRSSSTSKSSSASWMPMVALGAGIFALILSLWALISAKAARTALQATTAPVPTSALKGRVDQLESEVRSIRYDLSAYRQPRPGTATIAAVRPPQVPISQDSLPVISNRADLAPPELVDVVEPVILQPALDAWNALATDPQLDARTAFIRQFGVENASALPALAEDAEQLWWVPLRDKAMRGLLLPGWKAMRDWPKTYRGPMGASARAQFDDFYDQDEGGILRIVVPAVGKLGEGERIVVETKGRLTGA